MADYYALTRGPLPVLHGADGEYSIRTLVDRERLAIEDYFFRQGARVALDSNTTAVVVPQNQTASATLGEYAVLVEFALGVLAVSGFEPISIAANLDGATCIQAVLLNHTDSAERPAFPKRVVKATASAWLRHLFAVRRKIKERLHITADRFARYLRDPNSCDALVDLCICLESLIDTQTEVSFKFSTCLAKITGLTNSEQISEILSCLYDLRSNVVHGSDFTKAHRKIQPHLGMLRSASRTILTMYIVYLAQHSKEEWMKHLRSSLFA